MRYVDLKDCSLHDSLVKSYLNKKFLYSLSFKERLCVNTEATVYNRSYYSKEVAALSDEELEDRIASLKRPWWSWLYDKVLKKNKKFLYLVFLIVVRKDYSWNGLKLIWKVLKAKNNDFKE